MTTSRAIHIDFDIVRRSKGQHSVKISAYAAADRYEVGDGRTFDFTRKSGEHRGHAVLLPVGAPQWAADAAELWRRAEAVERQWNAQPARICTLEIPRQVPAERRMEFAAAVAQIWTAEGMTVQLDCHAPLASDSGENCHTHFQTTMRRFEGDEFATTKAREWNQAFMADRGRAMKQKMCDRANKWLAENSIDVRVDWRNAERQHNPDLPPPERNVSKKSWEAWRRRPGSDAAAPVREIMTLRQARAQLRRARAVEQRAVEEIRVIGQTIEARRPGVVGPRRRKGTPWIWDDTWTPEIRQPVTGVTVEADRRQAILTLVGGGQIIDRGNRLTIGGQVTDKSIAALAEQAKRHGWTKVAVTGDLVQRDKIAAALAVRGIEVANHKPTLHAIRAAEKQLAAARKAVEPPPQAPAAPAPPPPAPAPKPRPKSPEPDPEPSNTLPSLKPSWATPPWARPPGWLKERQGKASK
jgi:hypothetical protein